jgi:hypothetical protein
MLWLVLEKMRAARIALANLLAYSRVSTRYSIPASLQHPPDLKSLLDLEWES